MFPRLLHLCSIALLLAPGLASANDGAAVIGAGGIELRSEHRVSMRKERLFISPTRVRVEYEFVNESKEDVVTEVAFPVPEYRYSVASRWDEEFDDFRAWVGGQRIPVATEIRAFREGRDVTGLLESLGLDVRTLARVDQSVWQVEPDGRRQEAASLAQVPRLPPEKLERLREAHLIGGWGSEGDPSLWPDWSVRITYHWRQHFPPGQVVRIRHEYTPVTGLRTGIHPEDLDDACAPPRLRQAASGEVHEFSRTGSNSTSVAYVLTTANTWKTPIRDFELVVEHREGEQVAFCWEGRVQPAGPRTLRSRLQDFVPGKELTVFFFRVVPER